MAEGELAADFDAAGFRHAIRSAMVMGLPNAALERPTFIWRPTVRQTEKSDVAGNPYDWRPAPGATLPDPVRVSCAVELKASAGGELNAIGEFTRGDAVLTFLDEDFELVRGFTEVKLGGDTYLYVKQLPPFGLNTVTVYQVLVAARDES